MAFDALTTAEIQVGQPTRKEIFQKAKDNFDDHEDRLSAAEVGSTARPPIDFGVIGILNTPFSKTGILHYRTPLAITATGVRVFVITAGSSGTLEIDVEYKRDDDAWTTILTDPIQVDYSDGDLALESGTLAVTSFEAADVFRLTINSVQAGMEDFYVYIENEVS